MGGKKEKRFLAVLPARYASSRLPGKPLADIGGKPMIQHVYEKVVASGVFFKVVVATDDQRIFDACKNFGAEVMMTRADHKDGTSRVAEVAEKFDTDYVVNIQGDEPMIDPRMLVELVEGLKKDMTADSATMCKPITAREDIENPNIVKVVTRADGRALYFSRSIIPYERNPRQIPVMEHIGIYAFTKDFLMKLITLPATPLKETESLEQLKILEHGYSMAVIPTKYPPNGPNINTPEDLDLLRKMMLKNS